MYVHLVFLTKTASPNTAIPYPLAKAIASLRTIFSKVCTTGKPSCGCHLNSAASRGGAPINLLKGHREQQKTLL
jgi:hypothetical protein